MSDVIKVAAITVTGTVIGAVLGFGASAYTTYDNGKRADNAANEAVRKPAYVNFLKVSDTVLNASNGDKFEQSLRLALAQVQLVGSTGAATDAPAVANAALGGKDKAYDTARTTFLADARADLRK